MPSGDNEYKNIRDASVLGPFLGQRVVDITQQDDDEFAETHQSYVCIHFENGGTITFPIDDQGFDIDLESTSTEES